MADDSSSGHLGTRRPFQFGLSSLVWLVVFVACNLWLFSLGAWGGVLALVIDKHVLVAYLCMKARVDRRGHRVVMGTVRLSDRELRSRAA